MRAKVPEIKRHRARGVSLPPGMETLAMKRANRLQMSFSRYVQRLIELDIRERVLVSLEESR
jgi:hypothetical protein